MKRRKIFVVTFFISTCLFCGCQATPAEDVVVGKNDAPIERLTEVAPESEAYYDPGVENWQTSFRGASENVTIEVDAELVVPEVTKIPVFEMKPHEITEEEAVAWREAVCANYPAYEQIGTMTKEEIEEQILRMKQAMGEGGSLEEEYGDDSALLAEMRAFYEEEIAFYESKYASAPENYEREKAQWVFHPDSYYSSGLSEIDPKDDLLRRSMYFDVLIGQYTFGFFAHNYDGADYKIHYMMWATNDRRIYQKTPMEMTEEEARQMAEDFLHTTGLDENWKIQSCREESWTLNYEAAIAGDPDNEELREKAKNPESEYWYELKFVPVYGGIEVTPQSGIHTLKDSENPYAANYQYESLIMEISNGMIVNAYWNSPLEMVSVVNDNVNLLSWAEIAERFQSQAQIQYTEGYFDQGGEGGNITEVRVDVSEIRLGLARIREKDSEDRYYLVPAWTFMGKTRMDKGEGLMNTDEEAYSLMVINAVDGSIINTALGY